MNHKTLISRPKGAPTPIFLLGLRLKRRRRERWDIWTSSSGPAPDTESGAVIEKVSGAFSDGREASARVVATDHNPYLEVVLFGSDGSAVKGADFLTCPKDTVPIEVEGRQYRVGLLAVDTDGQAPTKENPYRDTARYECDSCGHESWRAFLPAAKDLRQRIAPGGTYTDRECPECGALMYPAPQAKLE
ncbi:putative RNA-binding Zn-ribbon protein involved in translation (DUF1610 family) [Salinibacter ruber]|jgi:predicted RNA-binding Zn-ribbon protein involved in translation (DUF1610 family)|uniref:RNA-binding Zn-ribbon protein involved in translation (DUF1610 family) n=1 Tax=Salinibacter ruber TaxID=146919 RepID=A0A9X2Q1G0_9BACT|nr:putative RNA-binding Zn-ribbon protein involved in translation (DUF1610 family) [Salinibacter ruber]MCS3709759.1 putative RNA-binding Zn-ribbon protein involved in translation (DUF1610 family) [Salinibacter ruber]MCS4170413.1 putative RNA-binding Zn-ribbon protein involved in translation (DUF1610 family) [Salinibacter ruber]